MDASNQTKTGLFTPQRMLVLFALVVAGESVFFLPFVIARIFRPALLEVFDITNSQLGNAYSIYGIVAMAAYLLGGPLADIFRPRLLIAISLITTRHWRRCLSELPFWEFAVRTVRLLGINNDCAALVCSD